MNESSDQRSTETCSVCHEPKPCVSGWIEEFTACGCAVVGDHLDDFATLAETPSFAEWDPSPNTRWTILGVQS
jgi:hypothetical protein